MAIHHYLVFGLHVASSRRISSLRIADAALAGEADVEIVEGEVRLPESARVTDGVAVSVEGDTCRLSIEECGRFEVTGGRKIVVDPQPPATPEQVHLYLLGSVFGVLLHQRRLLPFHCNAVEVDGSAFLFCGDSGAGKSTLAAYFVDRGHRLLSDDVCALSFSEDGRIIATPGVARLKLWQDALELFERGTEEFQLVPWYEDKFEVPLVDQATPCPAPVAAIYHLREAEDGRLPGIHPLRGLQAANAVTANIYRRRLGDAVGATPFYLAAATRIVSEIPIFSMNRTWGLVHFRSEAEAAEEHMHQLAAGQAPSGENPVGPGRRVQPARG